MCWLNDIRPIVLWPNDVVSIKVDGIASGSNNRLMKCQIANDELAQRLNESVPSFSDVRCPHEDRAHL
jgi:hypothetical protein